MKRNWEVEAEKFLRERFDILCQLVDQAATKESLRIEPRLAAEEAKLFLQGLETELYRIDFEGYVQSALLPPSGKNTKQKMCQIFWHNPPPPRLFREGVCQLSTAARLVLERGWPQERIAMEPTSWDHGPLAYSVDILLKTETNGIVAAVEVKRSPKELATLKRGFIHCSSRPSHSRTECRFPQNHPKHAFCARYRPHYFWAVAPGAEFCFKLSYFSEGIDLVEIATLPPLAEISH